MIITIWILGIFLVAGCGTLGYFLYHKNANIKWWRECYSSSVNEIEKLKKGMVKMQCEHEGKHDWHPVKTSKAYVTLDKLGKDIVEELPFWIDWKCERCGAEKVTRMPSFNKMRSLHNNAIKEICKRNNVEFKSPV